LRHGVKLVNYHIHLYKYPTAIHERMSRAMDKLVSIAYDENIIEFGSRVMSFLICIDFLALVYDNVRAKPLATFLETCLFSTHIVARIRPP
jgi:hypothetical protein